MPTQRTTTWSDLTTEARHPSSHDLDRSTNEQIVRLLLEEDRRGIERALRCEHEIALASDWMAQALAQEGDVLLVGAGTSGRLGIIEAAECPPTFGTAPERIRAVIAGGLDAVFAAREGAEDQYAEGQDVVRSLDPPDLVLGISASSVTAFVLGALDQARTQGLRTILLTCAPLAKVEGAADLVLALDTGPEILTGSTRLKAGSATKAVLNALTTTAMVRQGKAYQNLMVDLRPGSAKLVDRALRIVVAATDASPQEARRSLDAADGEVKTAIVMLSTSASVEEARHRLRGSAGHVRAALEGTD